MIEGSPYRPYEFPSSDEYLKLNRINNSEIMKKKEKYQVYPSKPFPTLKSSSYISSDQSDPNFHYISDSQVDSKTYKIEKIQVNPDPEENKIVFRRPDSSLYQNVQCLDKWFKDLPREDSDWIVRNQLKNEEMFRELIKLQKLQWDESKTEYDNKKQKHIPKFKCELETQALCDEEERNFNRKFGEYRLDRYPSNIDQQYQQMNQKIYGDNQQQSQQDKQPNYNYQSYQKIN